MPSRLLLGSLLSPRSRVPIVRRQTQGSPRAMPWSDVGPARIGPTVRGRRREPSDECRTDRRDRLPSRVDRPVRRSELSRLRFSRVDAAGRGGRADPRFPGRDHHSTGASAAGLSRLQIAGPSRQSRWRAEGDGLWQSGLLVPGHDGLRDDDGLCDAEAVSGTDTCVCRARPGTRKLRAAAGADHVEPDPIGLSDWRLRLFPRAGRIWRQRSRAQMSRTRGSRLRDPEPGLRGPRSRDIPDRYRGFDVVHPQLDILPAERYRVSRLQANRRLIRRGIQLRLLDARVLRVRDIALAERSVAASDAVP